MPFNWGYKKTVECLIRFGADVNAANISSRDSAIHFAVAFDRSELLPLLLEKGADYTALKIYGHDLGHAAALFAGTKFIHVMTRCNLRRLSLDVRDKEGTTAKDHMNERIILIDREIGIHEASESLVASLSALSEPNDKELEISNQCDFNAQTRTPDFSRLPGAFPQ